MFCSQCGSEASGRFCWSCGAKLQQGTPRPAVPESSPAYESSPSINETWDEDELPNIGDTILEEDDFAGLPMHGDGARDFDLPSPPPAAINDETVTIDWTYSSDYETVTGEPWVRRELAAAARRATGGVSAEKWLSLFDNVVPGTSLIANAVQPFYTRLGVKTGKSEQAVVPRPVGLVMFQVLKYLAENGQELTDAQQAEDGCLLAATIPSDIWSFQGTLYVQLQAAGERTSVELRTTIPGQMFDWGKSSRLLGRVLDELRKAA